MEEQEKVQPTSEPNPNGEENVNPSDLEDENPNPNQAEAGTDGQQEEGDQQTQEGGQKPPKQDRLTDARYAEERRKRKEREEALRKKREEELRRQVTFEVKSGQVTSEELSELGLDKVEDEDDLFLVESLRKAKADGVENPQVRAFQELRKKQVAERNEAKAKAEAETAEKLRIKKIVAEDQTRFHEKYGKTTAEVIKNEPEFMKKYGHLIYEDKGNFTAVYDLYMAEKSQTETAGKAAGSIPLGSGSGNQNPPPDKKPQTYEEFQERWKELRKKGFKS